MKKTLIIAMCCLTVLFAACKKEKPYEKFVGTYEGNTSIHATISFNSPIGTGMSQSFDFVSPMNITLSAGNADNKLILTYKPEDEETIYTTTGTITDNKVVFDPVQLNEVIDEYTVNAQVNMNGSITDNAFTLQGDINGTGQIEILPFSLSGNFSGVLNKVLTKTN